MARKLQFKIFPVSTTLLYPISERFNCWISNIILASIAAYKLAVPKWIFAHKRDRPCHGEFLETGTNEKQLDCWLTNNNTTLISLFSMINGRLTDATWNCKTISECSFSFVSIHDSFVPVPGEVLHVLVISQGCAHLESTAILFVG